MHADQRVEVAIGQSPVRQHRGDRVAQAPRAEQEVPQMGDLDGNEIAWLLDHDRLQAPVAASEVARDE